VTQVNSGRVVTVPGSKSIANRALVCAALADSDSVISNCAPGDDTEAMTTALVKLGVKVSRDNDIVSVSGRLDLDDSTNLSLDAKLAGTTSRFLTALCALRNGTTTIDGSEPLRRRPMAGLHDALRQLGASVGSRGQSGCLPVEVARGASWGAQIEIDASMSSQFTSALMMIAPYFPRGLEIELKENVVSRGYIEMTIGVMRAFGAQTDISGNKIWIAPGRYSGTTYQVEPDASSASYPLAAVAISGGQVTIAGLRRNSLQSDVAFADLLAQMGCTVSQSSAGLQVSRDSNQKLNGITVDMSQISDCVPTLAVVALFAQSSTVITGVEFIRAKESDRIGDLAGELRKLGANIKETQDGMVVSPSSLSAASLATHHDHRLAMAFGLLSRGLPGLVVQNPEVVSKSWPDYFDALKAFYF